VVILYLSALQLLVRLLEDLTSSVAVQHLTAGKVPVRELGVRGTEVLSVKLGVAGGVRQNDIAGGDCSAARKAV
jgi:hypothetical protein